MPTTLTVAPFGVHPSGQSVELYTFRTTRGVEVRICNYGGIVVNFLAPDRDGVLADVVLGYDSLDPYVHNNPYFGCLVGRYGNRIAQGRFTLDGTTYHLAQNDHLNSLHGGIKGFDKVVWTATRLDTAQGPTLRLSYRSPDGEEGYPGNLDVTADYSLSEDGGLRLDYTATTDKPTVVSLTQHSYFNLAGAGDILGHHLELNARTFAVIDAHFIPTGELRSVEGSPLDFRTSTPIGARIDHPDQQLRFAGGYDHNWVIDNPTGTLVRQARVLEPGSGRVLEAFSTEPGVQFYSGNFLDGSLRGKGGLVYHQRHGFCLEPQRLPDSPNQPHFPSSVLRPGQTYRSSLVYRLSTVSS